MYFVDFAERLQKKLEQNREKFQIRLLLMNLISRLVGVHEVGVVGCGYVDACVCVCVCGCMQACVFMQKILLFIYN